MIKGMVEEGLTYKLENVLVGFNDSTYRLTAHKYKVTMMGNSKFTKVDATSIPKNVFEFMSFKDVLSSTQEEKIIGSVHFIWIGCAYICPIIYDIIYVFKLCLF